jgi:hypothetical protein
MLGRLSRLLGGLALLSLGGWILIFISPVGLLFILFGIAITSLGIFPARHLQADQMTNRTGTVDTVRSFPVFKVVFAAITVSIVALLLFGYYNAQAIIVLSILTWIPFAAWTLRENRKAPRLDS